MKSSIKQLGAAIGVAIVGVVGYLSLSGQYVPGGGGGGVSRQDLEARKEFRYREEFELSSTTAAGAASGRRGATRCSSASTRFSSFGRRSSAWQ